MEAPDDTGDKADKKPISEDESPEPLRLETVERQDARSDLRERFLRVVTALVGRTAKFAMAERTDVRAEFGGIDIDFHEVFVRDLQTPIGRQPTALIRVNDIVSVTFDEL